MNELKLVFFDPSSDFAMTTNFCLHPQKRVRVTAGRRRRTTRNASDARDAGEPIKWFDGRGEPINWLINIRLGGQPGGLQSGFALHIALDGSVAEWLACWTQAQKGPGSNRSRDAVG